MTTPDPTRAAMQQALEALEAADRALHGAWQMLSAICDNDPSRDRIAARDKALAAWERNGASLVALRASLALPAEGAEPSHTHAEYADGFDDGKAQERERCARIADDEARIREEAGSKHFEGSQARSNCFAGARAAANVAKGIRNGEEVSGVALPTLPHPIGTIFSDGYWNLNVMLREPAEVEPKWRQRGRADVYTADQVRELLRASAPRGAAGEGGERGEAQIAVTPSVPLPNVEDELRLIGMSKADREYVMERLSAGLQSHEVTHLEDCHGTVCGVAACPHGVPNNGPCEQCLAGYSVGASGETDQGEKRG